MKNLSFKKKALPKKDLHKIVWVSLITLLII